MGWGRGQGEGLGGWRGAAEKASSRPSRLIGEELDGLGGIGGRWWPSNKREISNGADPGYPRFRGRCASASSRSGRTAPRSPASGPRPPRHPQPRHRGEVRVAPTTRAVLLHEHHFPLRAVHRLPLPHAPLDCPPLAGREFGMQPLQLLEDRHRRQPGLRSSSAAATRSNNPPSGSGCRLLRRCRFSDGRRGSPSSLYSVALLNPAFAAAVSTASPSFLMHCLAWPSLTSRPVISAPPRWGMH